MNTKHTPTPWKLDPDLIGQIVNQADTKLVARAGRVEPLKNLDQPEREANAEFIVRACNSHGLLVAAVKAQHGALDILMARLITLDPTFMPTKSEAWTAVITGNGALAAAGAA